MRGVLLSRNTMSFLSPLRQNGVYHSLSGMESVDNVNTRSPRLAAFLHDDARIILKLVTLVRHASKSKQVTIIQKCNVNKKEKNT